MNTLGILVDLSHCGRQTAADAIKAFEKPVAFTHTGSAALNDHPRNRTGCGTCAPSRKGRRCRASTFMPFLSEGKQPTASGRDPPPRAHDRRGRRRSMFRLRHRRRRFGRESSRTRFKRREFAGFVKAAARRGHRGAGRGEEGYLFANEAQHAAPLRDPRGHALPARPRRCAHRENPRQEPASASSQDTWAS